MFYESKNNLHFVFFNKLQISRLTVVHRYSELRFRCSDPLTDIVLHSSAPFYHKISAVSSGA